MTVKFGCFHTVFENKKATENIIKSGEYILTDLN